MESSVSTFFISVAYFFGALLVFTTSLYFVYRLVTRRPDDPFCLWGRRRREALALREFEEQLAIERWIRRIQRVQNQQDRPEGIPPDLLERLPTRTWHPADLANGNIPRPKTASLAEYQKSVVDAAGGQGSFRMQLPSRGSKVRPLTLPPIPDAPFESPSGETGPPSGLAGPSTTGQSESPLIEELQCIICLEDFQTGETLRVLPCHHYYHKTCVDHWLSKNTSCPVCRLDILPSLQQPTELPTVLSIPASLSVQMMTAEEVEGHGEGYDVERPSSNRTFTSWREVSHSR